MFYDLGRLKSGLMPSSLLILTVFLSGLLLDVSEAQAGCKWTVKGQVFVRGKTMPAKNVKIRVEARWAKKKCAKGRRGDKCWNNKRWPDVTTDDQGRFESVSKNLPSCKTKRKVRIRFKNFGKWQTFKHGKDRKRTTKTSRGRTVDFGVIEERDLFRLKCYPPHLDNDKDGYAISSACTSTVNQGRYFTRSESEMLTCKNGWVQACGDCDDTNSKVHPFRLERPGDQIDNNCNGGADETEYLYSRDGFQNRATSVDIHAKINDARLIFANSAGKSIFAKVKYQAIGESAVKTSRYIKPKFSIHKQGKAKPFLKATLRLNKLKAATVYWATVQFFERIDTSYESLTSNRGRYYWTVTGGGSHEDKLRAKAVKIGLNEYGKQLKGQVGTYGTKWVNGTRYGAKKDEWWCSEFYGWVTKNVWPKVGGVDYVHQIKQRFGDSDYRSVNNVRQLRGAKMGDFMSTGGETHTTMFLGIRSDGLVQTLEGNRGNRVRVHKRRINPDPKDPDKQKEIDGYGSLTKKLPPAPPPKK